MLNILKKTQSAEFHSPIVTQHNKCPKGSNGLTASISALKNLVNTFAKCLGRYWCLPSDFASIYQ